MPYYRFDLNAKSRGVIVQELLGYSGGPLEFTREGDTLTCVKFCVSEPLASFFAEVMEEAFDQGRRLAANGAQHGSPGAAPCPQLVAGGGDLGEVYHRKLGEVVNRKPLSVLLGKFPSWESQGQRGQSECREIAHHIVRAAFPGAVFPS